MIDFQLVSCSSSYEIYYWPGFLTSTSYKSDIDGGIFAALLDKYFYHFVYGGFLKSFLKTLARSPRLSDTKFKSLQYSSRLSILIATSYED